MIGLGTNPLMEVVPVTVEDVGARDLSLCLRRVDEGLQLLPGDELGLLDFEWLPYMSRKNAINCVPSRLRILISPGCQGLPLVL